MANISTLTVSLVAETGKFVNDLKKSKSAAQSWGKAVKVGMGVAAAGIGIATVALTKLTKESFKVVDAQQKMGRVFGRTQETMAGLQLIAEVSGTTLDGLNRALKRQATAIVSAEEGLTSYQEAFAALNLDTKELLKLPVEAQFKKIIGALGEMENQTLKVAAASDIFGTKNTDLINVIALGEDGIADLIDKVKELGVALSDKQTKAIEDSNDAITIMKTAFAGLGNQIAARVAPIIKRAADFVTNLTARITAAIPKWTAWASAIFGVRREIENLTLADLNYEIAEQDKLVRDAANALAQQKQNFRGQTIGGVTFDNEDQINALPIITRLQKAYNEENKRYNDLIKERLRLKKESAITEDPILDELEIDTTQADKFQRDFDNAFKATRTASEKLQIRLAEIRTNFETNPLWSADLVQREVAQAVELYVSGLRQVKQAQDAIVQSQKDAAIAATRSVATPAEELEFRINEIRENLINNPFWKPETAARQAKEAVDVYLAELKRIADENEKQANQINALQKRALENMQDILADYLFDPWQDGLDGMLQSFSDMLRKMVAQLLATKILEYFFGLFGANYGALTGTTTGNAIGIGRTDSRPRIVGENGPELFAPGASGSIRPLGAATFNMVTNISGGGNLDAATLIPILEENNRKLKGEFVDELRRGAFA